MTLTSQAIHQDPSTAQLPGRALRLKSFGMTDRGRVRKENQDHFLIADLAKALRLRRCSLPQPKIQFSHEQGDLFLVADGMGGHQGGEHASALALQTIEGFVLNTLKSLFPVHEPEEPEVVNALKTALREADTRVLREAAQHAELRGMGTTVTMAYRRDNELLLAHAGDSRCYLLRGCKLHQLTHDHTLVGEMVRSGCLSPEQAADHQLRHVLTNAVGGTEAGIQVETHKVVLEPEDVLLLCTDGLTEMLADDQIAAVLHAEADPRRACERLVAEANVKGGKDNVTVIVARFTLPDEGGADSGSIDTLQ
jgi:serine/threonine protein phosphatase PrpC